MKKQKINLIEYLVLGFTAIIVLIGVIAGRTDVRWFEEVYVVEDGFVENLTLLPLVGIVVMGIWYLRNLAAQRSRWFSIVICLSIVFSIFVAGEEISWGQRIFHVQSSEFFQKQNSQGETNLHNLVVGGKKVNKIIFSQLLTVCVALYLIVFPLLYVKNEKWRNFADYFGIPLPRLYQVIACVVLFVSISLIPSGKNAEVLEVGITHIFFLIYTFPLNISNFRLRK